ncbi:hypothetical protein ACFV0T_26380 [Streptomyces sp. NPDC059582]|uniref:hypothetical protein n=1 Tax=Streptomyces sp. NPDC059582 TaxID=3346875 RepID=UPI0036A08BA4
MPASIPHISRRLALYLAVLVTAAFALLTAAATPAHSARAAAAPVYQATGWKAGTAFGVYSLSPDPYTIVYADDTARTKLWKYYPQPASQITASVGVTVTATTGIDSTPLSQCPPYHRIIVHYEYRPAGSPGISWTNACHNAADGSAWGGHIRLDSEYWTNPAWFTTDPILNEGFRKDAAAHELGHILGLDHPNQDLDKDGVIEHRECVTSTAGRKPIMCSGNRGPMATTDAGRYTTEYDLPGLRQLLANYTLRQQP